AAAALPPRHENAPELLPYSPAAKKALELTFREALRLGHNYIGTEHMLLGLIRAGEGVAAQVLVKLGADLYRV
ncbi:Clp protease N-terminal domain-containing protein, partial [Methylobacterium frigidaeris]|uniref:Clp protease N-terminal domain-containing protein n=1 Tax=Methylobacterium frigidaeris TaxID=2038277 RepID=UPI0023593252